MGMFSECCGKEVYIYIIDILIIIITFPYSTCISSLFGTSSLFLCSFFKNFFLFLLMLFLCNVIIKNC